MKIETLQKNIYFVFHISEKIFFQKTAFISNLNSTKNIPITQFNGMLSEVIFFKLNESEIILYDLDLNELEKISICNSCGFQMISKNYYFISYELGNKIYYCFYINGIQNKSFDRFYGKILNTTYRLNFPDGTFTNPSTFTCSNLFGETTYWEYDFGEGLQANNS